MDVIRRRATALGGADMCADAVSTHRRNCRWMQQYCAATDWLVHIYGLMTVVIAASLCIALSAR